jgi:hypothetical protein
MVDTMRHSPASVTEMSRWPVTHFRTVSVRGIDIFYREAGPVDAPSTASTTGHRWAIGSRSRIPAG